jgi:hypothetical protein
MSTIPQAAEADKEFSTRAQVLACGIARPSRTNAGRIAPLFASPSQFREFSKVDPPPTAVDIEAHRSH